MIALSHMLWELPVSAFLPPLLQGMNHVLLILLSLPAHNQVSIIKVLYQCLLNISINDAASQVLSFPMFGYLLK